MLHQIGIGALGPVFRTYEPTRDRLVAVKVFRLDIVPEQAQALANALTRATQASLFHPSIVEPIAAGVEGTVAYRAEEYVAAESLDVAMRHYAPAPLEKALPYVAQLAGAIDFARAAGVGHGGLHPRDIFITPDEARATGFGIVEALEQVGIRAPTRRPYAAPERIDGGPWSTPADVFSLAAITFELLTGRRPSGTGAQIGALPDGAHSGALHAVLARAMDDDPAKRFSTALGFAGALEAAGRGEVAPPPPAVAIPAAPAVAPVPAAAPLLAPPPVAAAPPPIAVPPAAPLPPAAPPPVAAVPPVVSQPPAAAPPVRPAVPTPGEFEIEKQVDPILAAIDRNMAVEHELDHAVDERSLFDPSVIDAATAREPEDSRAGSLADLEDVEPERFADDFVSEQEANAEARRPLEASLETAAPAAAAAEAPMFRSFDSSPESDDRALGERSHVLPYAMLVIGLLVGFGAAYFLFGRDRVPPAGAPAAAARPPQTAPAASGAATPEKPGQYSEQKVTAPPPGRQPPVVPAAPPPAASEKAAPARPAAAPPKRPEPAPTRGRLVVTSTPPRAAVTLNGKWRGRTPLTLDDLPFGRYTVRVVQPGYITAREEFSLSARDASHEFAARLYRDSRGAEPAPRAGAPRTPAPATPDSFTGSLFVDSRPRGATVFVDGRSVGQTPLSIPGVPVGAHVVRLELAGKKTWSVSTRVTSGQTARVTGSLEDR